MSSFLHPSCLPTDAADGEGCYSSPLFGFVYITCVRGGSCSLCSPLLAGRKHCTLERAQNYTRAHTHTRKTARVRAHVSTGAKLYEQWMTNGKKKQKPKKRSCFLKQDATEADEDRAAVLSKMTPPLP